MSRAEIEDLLHQAEHLPVGHERLELCDRAVRLADLEGDDQLAYDTRVRYMDATYQTPAQDRRLLTFAWLLAEHDRHPERGSLRSLLWYFKWVATDLPGMPAISRARVEALLADMDRRFAAFGAGQPAALRVRHEVGLALGDETSVAGLLEQAHALDRDTLSDCEACDASDDIRELVRRGEDEAALAMIEPLTDPSVGCAAHPTTAYALSMLPLLRLGRVEEAVAQHRRALRLALDKGGAEHHGAAHLELLARTGSFERGLEVALLHAAWADRVVSATSRLAFLRSVLLLLEAGQDRGAVVLPLPAGLLGGPDAAAVAAGTPLPPPRVAAAVRAVAEPLARVLDARNGNDTYARRVADVPGWLAELVVDAPLEPAAAPATPLVPAVPVVVVGEQTVAPERPPAQSEPGAGAGFDEVWSWADSLYEHGSPAPEIHRALDRADALATTEVGHALCARQRGFVMSVTGEDDGVVELVRGAAEVLERYPEHAEDVLRCWVSLAADVDSLEEGLFWSRRAVDAFDDAPARGRAGVTRVRAIHRLLLQLLSSEPGDDVPSEVEELWARLQRCIDGWTSPSWPAHASFAADLANTGRSARADAELDALLARTDGPVGPARWGVLQEVASGHLRTGDETRARALGAQLLREAEAAGDAEWVAEGSLTYGRSLVRTQPDLAVAPLRRVIRFDDAKGWSLAAARARLLLGEALDQLRREDEAVEVLDVAAAAAEAAGETLMAVEVLYLAARSLRDVHDLDGARARLDRAVAILQASAFGLALPAPTPHPSRQEDGYDWLLLPALEPAGVLEQAYWTRALLERRTGDVEVARSRWAAVPAYELAAALHLAGGDDAEAVDALTVLARELLEWDDSHAPRSLGLLATAAEAADRAALAGSRRPGSLELDVDVARVSALLAAGREGEAVGVARERAGLAAVRADSGEPGDAWLAARAEGTLGRTLGRVGDVARAVEHLEAAAARFDAIGETGAAANARRERDALQG